MRFLNFKITLILLIISLILSTSTYGRIAESTGSTSWTLGTTWTTGAVPTDGDTVIILSGHTVTLSGTINNNDYLFIVIRGALDLSAGGKLKIGGTSVLIIEDGGSLIGNNQPDQVQLGGGPAEYTGALGDITGPSFVSDGHEPTSGEGLPTDYTPLPVELISFSGTPGDGEIFLHWSTASELNNDFFTLEKSKNGKDFEIIAKVEGNGTSHVQIDYSYSDNNPYLGISYYRLSQTDYDGTKEVFPTISILYTHTSAFAVFPNPLKGESFRLRATEILANESVLLNIYSLQGRLVFQENLLSDVFGNLDSEIEVGENLKKGSYILELVSSDSKNQIKILKE